MHNRKPDPAEDDITGKPLQAINEILAGKKSITPETALLFSNALGTTAEFWLNLEAAYRLDRRNLLGKRSPFFAENK